MTFKMLLYQKKNDYFNPFSLKTQIKYVLMVLVSGPRAKKSCPPLNKTV